MLRMPRGNRRFEHILWVFSKVPHFFVSYRGHLVRKLKTFIRYARAVDNKWEMMHNRS
jgi:hypothetical protein